jgi:hypothetical protein
MGVLTFVEVFFTRCPIWPCMLNGIASSIIILAAIRFVVQYFRSGKAR